MTKDEFLKEYGEFSELFEIVSEPSYSKEMLLKFEDKYSVTGLNSHFIYWMYKVQGFMEVAEYIKDIDDWVYYYDRFLRYGGNIDDLKKCEDISSGQVYKEGEKASGSKEPLAFTFLLIDGLLIKISACK